MSQLYAFRNRANEALILTLFVEAPLRLFLALFYLFLMFFKILLAGDFRVAQSNYIQR